jgi:zinc/manganese transport system ATP-binding protein
MPDPADIELRDLTAGYERHPAVHHVSLRWRRGDLAAVVGPNGAGKSTLLKCVAGRLRPDARACDRGFAPSGRVFAADQ